MHHPSSWWGTSPVFQDAPFAKAWSYEIEPRNVRTSLPEFVELGPEGYAVGEGMVKPKKPKTPKKAARQ